MPNVTRAFAAAGNMPSVGLRVLLVEDEPGIADFVVRGLREEGFTVEHAPDGTGGLHALREVGRRSGDQLGVVGFQQPSGTPAEQDLTIRQIGHEAETSESRWSAERVRADGRGYEFARSVASKPH